MNKRQKKKLEDKKNIEKLQSKTEGVNARLQNLEIGMNVMSQAYRKHDEKFTKDRDNIMYAINVSRENIKSLLSTVDYMERNNGARMKELEEKYNKLKEENSILIEEQEKQGKRITGIYIMILIVIVLEVVQWWILHA